MANNFNSARRVLNIIRSARNQNPAGSTADAWAAAFKIALPMGPRRDLEVVKMLALLDEETQLAMSQIRASGLLSESVYDGAFASVFKSFGVTQLSNIWNQNLPYLAPEVIKMVEVCAEIIPSEGDVVGDDVLAAMAKDLEALRSSVIASEMPSAVRAFFFEQINILLRAIREYAIKGAKAFSNAVSEAVVSSAEHPEEAEAAKKTSQFAELAAVWKKVKDAVTNVDTVVKALTWVRGLHDEVALLTDHLPI